MSKSQPKTAFVHTIICSVRYMLKVNCIAVVTAAIPVMDREKIKRTEKLKNAESPKSCE